MTDEIAFAVQNGVATILLNRPQALNALTHTMCVPLERHLRDWAKDAAVRAVIIKAAGDKAFCAGGDIRKLADRGPDGTAYRQKFWHDEYRCHTLIREYPTTFIPLNAGLFLESRVGLSCHVTHRILIHHPPFPHHQ